MSSPRAIPKRKQPRQQNGSGYSYGGSSAASSSAFSHQYPSWNSNSNSDGHASPGSYFSSALTPSSSSTPPLSMPPSSALKSADRRPSLLGSSLSKSEYTVVNVGGPDGPPRLITCVKSSQGFDWNQDIFLPSYLDYDSSDLEHKPDPVQEIVLTDEEAASLFPQ